MDYRSNVPAAREPEVLSTIAAIVHKLENNLTREIPQIFDAVFECTLEMINKDFEEFPEYRTNFFLLLQVWLPKPIFGDFQIVLTAPKFMKFLAIDLYSVRDMTLILELGSMRLKIFQAVNNNCFPALLAIPPAQFKLVLDSIIWAFKHTMRNVADTGEFPWLRLLRSQTAEIIHSVFIPTSYENSPSFLLQV